MKRRLARRVDRGANFIDIAALTAHMAFSFRIPMAICFDGERFRFMRAAVAPVDDILEIIYPESLR